jgi:hypothetical protein
MDAVPAKTRNRRKSSSARESADERLGELRLCLHLNKQASDLDPFG